MARLQILELPEGTGDDRPPFVLVIDQVPSDEAAFEAIRRDLLTNGDLAPHVGARAVLVFETTIDIPANDTTAYLEAARSGLPADAHYEMTIGGKAVDWTQSDELRARAVDDAQERVDMDRLAKRKHELLDALGMDRTRDWDDIRNAATALRKQRDTLAEAVERVGNLHRPVEHRGQVICWECSDYDLPGQTTDSPPVLYDQCATLRAVDGRQATPDA